MGAVIRSRRRRRAGLCVALGLLVGSACTGDDESVDSVPEIGADTYVAAIERFLPPSTDPELPPVVYVVPVAGEALPLDTQIAVIDTLAETHDVRFVDDYDAAVDGNAEDDPPRDHGTLIGLGTVTEEAPHTVRVEVYRERDQVEGHLLTLEPEGDRWVVVLAETVAPEVLVGGE